MYTVILLHRMADWILNKVTDVLLKYCTKIFIKSIQSGSIAALMFGACFVHRPVR